MVCEASHDLRATRRGSALRAFGSRQVARSAQGGGAESRQGRGHLQPLLQLTRVILLGDGAFHLLLRARRPFPFIERSSRACIWARLYLELIRLILCSLLPCNTPGTFFRVVRLRGDAASTVEAGLRVAHDAQARRPKLSYLYTTGAGVNAGMKALFIEPFLFLPKPYTMEQLTKSVAFLLLSANPRPRIKLPGE
jgi:hypothetical protein